MKKFPKFIGLCIIAIGVSILLSCFLPPMVLVCIEAVLLIAAGLFCLQL